MIAACRRESLPMHRPFRLVRWSTSRQELHAETSHLEKDSTRGATIAVSLDSCSLVCFWGPSRHRRIAVLQDACAGSSACGGISHLKKDSTRAYDATISVSLDSCSSVRGLEGRGKKSSPEPIQSTPRWKRHARSRERRENKRECTTPPVRSSGKHSTAAVPFAF
jgi:hypothetical protein